MTVAGEKRYAKRYWCSHQGDKELIAAEDIWLPILKYGIRTATHFEAHFPDDDSYLAEGKDEVRQLPKTFVEPWSGMEGAIAVYGEMTPEARALFMKVAEEGTPWLWDYELIRDGEVLITVSDHEDRTVSENFIKEYMQKVFESWFRPIPKREDPPQRTAALDQVFKALLEETKQHLSDLGKNEPEKDNT